MSDLAFGLSIAPSAADGADPVAAARMAEDLGFDFVSASDHPCGTEPTYETWTLLSWIAAATTRIRIATRVLGVPYRNPAMVAKMAETFSRLSGGRLILGLGGGYSDDEFRAFGLGAFAIGFTAFSVNLAGPGRREQAEKLAQEVIPAVRAAQ